MNRYQIYPSRFHSALNYATSLHARQLLKGAKVNGKVNINDQLEYVGAGSYLDRRGWEKLQEPGPHKAWFNWLLSYEIVALTYCNWCIRNVPWLTLKKRSPVTDLIILA